MTRAPGQDGADIQVRLASFQNGEAVLHVSQGGRTTRLLLDQVSSGRASATAPEAAREALVLLVDGLARRRAEGRALVDER